MLCNTTENKNQDFDIRSTWWRHGLGGRAGGSARANVGGKQRLGGFTDRHLIKFARISSECHIKMKTESFQSQ